ncbi:MAG: hypothetical protein GX219_01210 [Tissierellia bacterium]|nr:hypothetical protein [Tissierellia bacterium]
MKKIFLLLVISFIIVLSLKMNFVKDFQQGDLLIKIRLRTIQSGEKTYRSKSKIYDGAFLDITGDDKKEIIILEGDKRVNGKKFIKIFDQGLNELVQAKDATILNPSNFQVSDVNGDGVKELSFYAYKKALHHPVYAQRPFFYIIEGEELKPFWRGSRLSSPFTEFTFFDRDKDGRDELYSIEYTGDNRKRVKGYEWTGFGFEVFYQGEVYLHISNLRVEDGDLSADFYGVGKMTIGGGIE